MVRDAAFDVDRIHAASTREWQMTHVGGGCHAGDQAHTFERLLEEHLASRVIACSGAAAAVSAA